ncbi:hypothetical protein [Marisediminicola sp. LYQ134]|uniref:hypothetical protein n=1 Tax=Marisediminicola sp. LYQ134 TaxID=3391061 RepID=UPI003983C5FA
MTNIKWSETDIAEAAGRVQRAVVSQVKRGQRTRRIGITAGIALVGVLGIGAATTALPPQTKGEIGAAAPYVADVHACLAAEGWNVWLADSSDGQIWDRTIHFSVSGYDNLSFADDIDTCRADVAAEAGVSTADVIGLP